MTGSNGSPVTWRELDLALEPLKEDVREIKQALKESASQSWLGPRGRDMLVAGGCSSAIVAFVVAVFFH